MRRVYTCFPGGKYKALTVSYDDGKMQDERLIGLFNRYGIKGTFHLNSDFLSDCSGHRTPCVDKDKVPDLYCGHEVACHTCTHPTMDRTPMALNLQETVNNRISLEQLVEYPVRGMSYPNGVYNEEIKEAMRLSGIAYSRIVGNSENFKLPEDPWEWMPTCHHNHKLLELTDTFLSQDRDQHLSLFYVWGHSYEFDRDDNWELIEEFAAKVGLRDTIWYASNIEIINYMENAKRLHYFADGSGVYNPSALTIWLFVDGEIVEIAGGELIRFDMQKKDRIFSMNQRAYHIGKHSDILYKPVPEKEYRNGLDPKLIQLRKNKKPKTEGNPYMFLDIPVGDMRDNMGADNLDLSEGVSTKSCEISGVPVRIYEKEQKKDRPCFVFIHGGGFIGGDIEVVENPCRYIADKANALVINIDYRLAPEHPYPQALLDCQRVVNEVYEDKAFAFDRKRFGIGGDSAGGNLAAGCVIHDSRNNQYLSYQALLYPVTDIKGDHPSWSFRFENYRGFEDDMVKQCASSLLGFEEVTKKLYLQNEEVAESEAISPIYIKEASNFPKTLICSAEYDYLRDQVEAFYGILKDLKVPVRCIRYGGVNHAFLDQLGRLDQAVDCLNEIVKDLKDL